MTILVAPIMMKTIPNSVKIGPIGAGIIRVIIVHTIPKTTTAPKVSMLPVRPIECTHRGMEDSVVNDDVWLTETPTVLPSTDAGNPSRSIVFADRRPKRG